MALLMIAGSNENIMIASFVSYAIFRAFLFPYFFASLSKNWAFASSESYPEFPSAFQEFRNSQLHRWQIVSKELVTNTKTPSLATAAKVSGCRSTRSNAFACWSFC
jgi:hypothetical protein